MELILENIRKSFGSKEVLKGATFTFKKGKIYGLLGRNGAGKTTLFNCLSDEIQADHGEALLQYEDGRRTGITTCELGYVFSTPILPDFLTGYEFVKFYMDINSHRIQSDKTPDDYLDLVNIAKEDRNRLLKGYSHGMKNKIQMLCFLISKPLIILLDEPLTSFDVVAALEMKNLLREMKKDHIIIFSTHILQLATDLCDEIVVLHEGKLEKLDPDMLESEDFEARIIEMLKDDDSHV